MNRLRFIPLIVATLILATYAGATVAVNGSTIELTLATSIGAGQAVTVGYTAPTKNAATTNAAVQENWPAMPVIATPLKSEGALIKKVRPVAGPIVVVIAPPPLVADS
jgi:hypothetical protein